MVYLGELVYAPLADAKENTYQAWTAKGISIRLAESPTLDMKRLSCTEIHESLLRAEGRIKEAAASLGVNEWTFSRNAKRNGIDYRSYRKSLCTCGRRSPRCEGCKRQNRESQQRAYRANRRKLCYTPSKPLESQGGEIDILPA